MIDPNNNMVMNWKPEPEYQYVWEWIAFDENDVRSTTLIGVFDSMDEVRRYYSEQFVSRVLSKHIAPVANWYQIDDMEYWISVPLDMMRLHDVNHHAVVRCKRNGGLTL